MATYTVIGLWLDDEPEVAGVVEGRHGPVDMGPPGFGDTNDRWATFVEAEGPEEAERVAVTDMLRMLD